MANKFNIVAELQLRGPQNLSKVSKDIKRSLKGVDVNVNLKASKASISNFKRSVQRQLGNITVNVDLQLSKNAQQQLQKNAQSLDSLSSNAKSASKATSQLSSANQKLSSGAKQSAKNIQEAATAAEAFGKQSALAVKRFAAFTVAAGTMAALVGAMKNGVAAAIEFEREMVKVSQVTGKSMDSLKALSKEITGLSTSLGASSAELVNVSRILSQTGLRANEVKVALKTLAQSSLAPTFKDMANTAEGAIAIMRQFGVTADQLGAKLGSINALAGQFAVESQDLIFAIRRAGGAFQAAGGSLEELLALFTSVRATTRESAETIATGFRTIFTRIQRPKTIEFLKSAGIELQNLQGQFVGPFEAIRRLNAGLKDLESTDPRFQQIIEELGGFRQVSKVIPLIQQFATAQRALGVAQEGSGSIAKDAATAQQSLGVQILKVREQFLSLFRDIAGSKTFQVFAKTALNLASSFIKMGEAIKPILPLIGAFAAFQGIRMGAGFLSGFAGGFKGQGGAKGVGQNIAGNITGQTQAATATKQVTALTSNTQALLKLTTAVAGLSSAMTRIGAASSVGGRAFRGGRPTFGPGFASGGIVPGVGNGDTVPAMLEPGEFVIRKSSVKKYGAENLARMNSGGTVQKFKNGSTVKKTSGEKTFAPINLGTINATDSPGAFILLPENSKDSKFTVKDKAFTITNSGTENSKAIKRFLSKTGMDTSKGRGRFMLKGQQHLPRFKGTFKGGTFPAMYPGRDDLEKSAYQNIIRNETSKGMADLGANIAKQVAVDLPGIGLDASDSLIKKDMARIQSDKGLLETVQGYAFEAMIGGVTGASIGGQGAAFDVPNISSADPNRLNAVFGKGASSLSRAEVKRNIDAVKKDDAFTRKLKNQFVADLSNKGFDASRYSGGTSDVKKFAKGGKTPKGGRDFSGGQIAIRPGVITARYGKGSGKSGQVTAGKMFGKLWEVSSSEATKGFGPHLYDMVMEGVTSKGGMLVSDRASVSPSAKKVWDFYYSRRGDVNKTQLPTAEWPMGNLLDMKKFASEDPKTWPPKSDVAAWSLLHGYSKTPSIINGAGVQKMAKGGEASDTVPALLTPGEFVINKKSAQRIGYSNLNAINKGSRVQGFANGGPVEMAAGGEAKITNPEALDKYLITADGFFGKLIQRIQNRFDEADDFVRVKSVGKQMGVDTTEVRQQMKQADVAGGKGVTGAAMRGFAGFIEKIGKGISKVNKSIAVNELTNDAYVASLYGLDNAFDNVTVSTQAATTAANKSAAATATDTGKMHSPQLAPSSKKQHQYKDDDTIYLGDLTGTTMGAPGSIPGMKKPSTAQSKIQSTDTGKMHGPEPPPDHPASKKSKEEREGGSDNLMMFAMAAPGMIDAFSNSIGMGGEKMQAFTGAMTTGIATFAMFDQAMKQLSEIPGPIGERFKNISKTAKTVAAGFAVAGMIAKGFGDNMKKSGLEGAEKAAFEGDESAIRAQEGTFGSAKVGGALSGAGTGAMMGAQVGAVFGPLGAAIGGLGGAIVGGVKGYFDAGSELVKAIQKGRQARFMKNASDTLKKIEKQGVSRASTGNLAREVGGIMDNMKGATNDNFKEFREQAKQMLPGMQSFVDAAMEGSDTFEDAVTKHGDGLEEVARHMANLKGISFEEFKKELNESAKLQAKVRAAEKAREDAADSTRSLVQETNNLRDAFAEAGRQVSRFAKTSAASAAIAMGQSVNPTLGGAFGSGVIGASAAGQRVDLTQLEEAINQVAPNQGVADAALEIGQLTNELPGILEAAQTNVGFGATDDDFKTAVKNEMENRGIDTGRGAGASILAGITSMLAKDTAKGEGGLIGQAQEDPGKLAAQLMKEATPELLNALQAVGDAIVKTQQELLSILNTRNKLEHELTKQRLQTFDNQSKLQDFEDSITPDYEKGSVQSRIEAIQQRDLDRQKTILGGGQGASGTADLSGLAGNVPAMQEFLSATNDAIRAERERIESLRTGNEAQDANNSQLLDSVKKLKGLELQSQRVRAALEDAAKGGASLGQLQNLLSEVSRTRQFIAGQLTSQVTFGTEQSRQQFSDTTTAAQALASGEATMDDIPEEMRGAVLQYLQGLGTGGQGMLSGKSGAQVVQEQNEAMLRETYADELASGDMSEEEFQDIVDATFKASETEKMVMDAIREKMINMVDSSKALEQILRDELIVQDKLVADAVAAGTQAIVDALNAIELERAKSEAQKAKFEADKKGRRARDAKEAEDVFGTEQAMQTAEENKDVLGQIREEEAEVEQQRIDEALFNDPSGAGSREELFQNVKAIGESDMSDEDKKKEIFDLISAHPMFKDMDPEKINLLANKLIDGASSAGMDNFGLGMGNFLMSNDAQRGLFSEALGEVGFATEEERDAKKDHDEKEREKKKKEIFDKLVAQGMSEEEARDYVYGSGERASGASMQLAPGESFQEIQDEGEGAAQQAGAAQSRVDEATAQQQSAKDKGKKDKEKRDAEAEQRRKDAHKRYVESKKKMCAANGAVYDEKTDSCKPKPGGGDPESEQLFDEEEPLTAANRNDPGTPTETPHLLGEDYKPAGVSGTAAPEDPFAFTEDPNFGTQPERDNFVQQSAGGYRPGTKGFNRAKDKAQAEAAAKQEEQKQAFVTALTEFTGAISSGETPLISSLNSFIETFGGEEGLKMTLRMPDGISVNVTGLNGLEGPVQQAVIQDIGDRLSRLEGVVSGDRPVG